MVDSINIPKDIGKVLEITVKDTSGALTRFLTDLLIRVENVEKTNKSLEERIKKLEMP